jgi:hypothetical protein
MPGVTVHVTPGNVSVVSERHHVPAQQRAVMDVSGKSSVMLGQRYIHIVLTRSVFILVNEY